MTQWHEKSRRKQSGGIRTSRRRRDKRLAQKGGIATHTEIEEKEKRSKISGRGSTEKIKERRTKFASVVNTKTKKAEKAEIIEVEKNDANKLFVRRNIITKGAIIKVKIGGKEEYAKVTSRPGQQGQVQAILVEAPKQEEKPKKKKKQAGKKQKQPEHEKKEEKDEPKNKEK